MQVSGLAKTNTASQNPKMRSSLVDKKGFKSFCKEVTLLAMLSHPNVVRFIGYCTRPALLIVMSFCDGGELSGYINALRDKEKVASSFAIL